MKKIIKNLLITTLVVTITNSLCYISNFHSSYLAVTTCSERNTGGEASTT